MKKKTTYGFGTKIFLIVLFICGFFMFCNLLRVFDKTERIEGIVEHTYISQKYNSITKRSSKGSPMCRVVWYDKDGEKVSYGMPNDLGYKVGDSYYLEVDVDTNRIPKCSVREGMAAGIIGLILCVVSVISWKIKFKTLKNRYGVNEMKKE